MLFSVVGTLAALTCVNAEKIRLLAHSVDKEINSFPVYYHKEGDLNGFVTFKYKEWAKEDPESLDCKFENGIIFGSSSYLGYENGNYLYFYENRPDLAIELTTVTANKKRYLQVQNEGVDQGMGTVFHLISQNNGYYFVSVFNPDQDAFNPGDYLINLSIACKF